jgi:HAD superfamily hydrolase (TIGR01490 family)
MPTYKSNTAAFIDMDFTLYTKYLYEGLFAHHRQNKFRRHTLALFVAYHFPIWQLSKIGLISKEYLYNEHATNLAWLVRGVSVERADSIWDWVLENEIVPHIRPEMVSVIEEHKIQGHRIILNSGSFTPILDKVVAYLGIEDAIATPLTVKNGRYTGKIIPPLNIGNGKVERLNRFLTGPGKEIDLTKSYFYTDSVMDLPVLKLFGNPVAVYPDEYLAKTAKAQNWQIIGQEHRFGNE